MSVTTLGALLILVLAAAIVVFIVFTRRLLLDAIVPRTRPPQDFTALIVRGYARRDAGDVDGALADFRAVLRLRPDHPEAAALRAEITRLTRSDR